MSGSASDDYASTQHVRYEAAHDMLYQTQLELGHLRALVEAQRARFRTIFAHAPIPIAVIHGLELVCIHANRAALNLVGDREVVGKPLLDVLPELREAGCDRLLREVMVSGIGYVGDEVIIELPGHSPVSTETYWTFICAPLQSAADEARDVVVVFADVTEQIVARRALQRQNGAKDEFLAMLSHELRSPLSAIQAALESMRFHGSDTREQAVIERQAGHMATLVDDLLDIEHIRRGKMELRKQRTELAQIVRAAVEMVDPMLQERHQMLVVDVPQGLYVEVDADRIRQVVTNLLSNAAKYSQEQSEISITAKCKQDKVRLAVTDWGSGMDSDLVEHVFEAYVRGQSGEQPSGGFGLGLAIVRKLVELHGGQVHAYSYGPGRGSEFVVEIPNRQDCHPT